VSGRDVGLGEGVSVGVVEVGLAIADVVALGGVEDPVGPLGLLGVPAQPANPTIATAPAIVNRHCARLPVFFMPSPPLL
jgi:hypothetical protein